MRPFTFETVATIPAAIAAAESGQAPSHVANPTQFLAGGTTLVDLMTLDVMRPTHLVDINPLSRDPDASHITVTDKGIRLGALVRMSELANHEVIQRDYAVIAQTMTLAASSGLRNMASLGGNVLQRTRCSYFRDTSYAQCNKRMPGSGCAALDGVNRGHAVLGVSDHCIASYPGDFAQALMALDAVLEVQGAKRSRALHIGDLHRRPGATPEIETNLQPGELITAIYVPAPGTRRSVYVKVRDRASYAFALASAAVVLVMEGDKVGHVRIALGGVASVPWRASDAEAHLIGKPLDAATAKAAAEVAFAEAKPRKDNAYKVPLGKETLVRALLEAAKMEA